MGALEGILRGVEYEKGLWDRYDQAWSLVKMLESLTVSMYKRVVRNYFKFTKISYKYMSTNI